MRSNIREESVELTREVERSFSVSKPAVGSSILLDVFNLHIDKLKVVSKHIEEIRRLKVIEPSNISFRECSKKHKQVSLISRLRRKPISEFAPWMLVVIVLWSTSLVLNRTELAR